MKVMKEKLLLMISVASEFIHCSHFSIAFYFTIESRFNHKIIRVTRWDEEDIKIDD
jgi:hypothetical protein